MDYLEGLRLTHPEAESQQPHNFHLKCNIFMRQMSVIQNWKTTAAEAVTSTWEDLSTHERFEHQTGLRSILAVTF